MNKNKKLLIAGFLFFLSTSLILIFVLISLLSVGHKKGDHFSSNWSHDITIDKTSSVPATSQMDFQVNSDGYHTLSLSWIPSAFQLKDLMKIQPSDMGFITTLIILDDNGQVIYSTSGSALYIDTTILLSASDTYHAHFYYLTDHAQYQALAAEYLCAPGQVDHFTEPLRECFDLLGVHDKMTMNYTFSATKEQSFSLPEMLLVLLLMVSIVTATFLCLALIRTSSKYRQSFDERQELERGRGFTYSFTALLAYQFLFVIFGTNHVFPSESFWLYSFTGVILSIVVYVTYCVWHEAYIALNEKLSSALLIFAIITICNFVIALSSLLSGKMFSGGHIDYTFINLEFSIISLILFFIILLKTRSNAKRSVAEDEED